MVDAFAGVADAVRRSLLVDLAAAPFRVVDLAAGRGLSRPAVSRHLRVLLEAGLVTVEGRGRERWYRLRPDGLADIEGFLSAILRPRRRIAPEALDALDLEVRRTGRERRRTGRPRERTTDAPTHETTDEETA